VNQPDDHIILSDRDRDRFLAAIDRDAQPNEAMKRAVETYKKLCSEPQNEKAYRFLAMVERWDRIRAELGLED
jgi:hypothetical protein